MSLPHIVLLAIIQGLAELLPVSSSAHVVVAERLLGMDPSAPPMTLLLVMLHTGTMGAVIVYFWRPWRAAYFGSRAAFRRFAWQLVVATLLTALVGGGLIELVQRTLLRGAPQAQIEDLFNHLELIAPALAAAGVLICVAGIVAARGAGAASRPARAVPLPSRSASLDPSLHARSGADAGAGRADLDLRRAGIIGVVQGFSLPFRGFSRSGATISAGLLLGVNRVRVEAFSFALAVVLTPAVIAREAMRLLHAAHLAAATDLSAVAGRCLLGALLAFLAGLAALKWLSRWLESGRWYWFGIYCLVAAAVVGTLYRLGY